MLSEIPAFMLTSSQETALRNLVKVFLAENAKLNLSALRTEEKCWIGNVLDSLALLEALPKFSTLNSQFSILDLGTGGGFPLLPLAICLPQASLTGIDSTTKKVDAVRRIVAALGLSNVSLIAGRAEALGHDATLRERFDVVTSRAVAPINVLLEYCSAFAKPKGYIVLWKSLRVTDELADSALAQAQTHCRLIKQHEYNLPGDLGKRQLLIFAKSAPLPKKYPREVGVPSKKPLQ